MRYPAAKEFFSRIGPLVSPKAIHFANGILNYLAVGRWFHDRGLSVPVRLGDRESLYELISKQLVEPVSYLEFGVLKGDSLRIWTRLLKHPETYFHGFDSFEGLPENWRIMDKSLFDVGGKIPRFDDTRVKLFKGWFVDTVPPYVADLHPHKSLVLHLDADLYSSTAFVLKTLRPFIVSGTILVFDEFFDREHELKAFDEFLNETKFKIQCIAASRALTQSAFQII